MTSRLLPFIDWEGGFAFQWSTGPVMWDYNFPMEQADPVTAISSSSWAKITLCLRAALYQRVRFGKWPTLALYKGSYWSSGRQWLSARDQINQVTDSGPLQGMRLINWLTVALYNGSVWSSGRQWLSEKDQINQVADSGPFQGIRLIKWLTVALYNGSYWPSGRQWLSARDQIGQVADNGFLQGITLDKWPTVALYNKLPNLTRHAMYILTKRL